MHQTRITIDGLHAVNIYIHRMLELHPALTRLAYHVLFVPLVSLALSLFPSSSSYVFARHTSVKNQILGNHDLQQLNGVAACRGADPKQVWRKTAAKSDDFIVVDVSQAYFVD